MFSDFETVSFPKESCTIPHARETGVWDSHEVYLCAIVDKRWPTQLQFEHLRPYMALGLDGETMMFGWARTTTDGYVDHVSTPIHGDDVRVIAWKKVGAPISFMPADWPEWGED